MPRTTAPKKTLFQTLARRLRTPKQVQRFIQTLKYNREIEGETLRSAAEAIRSGQAHCFEAAFIAAAILEHHGYPPTVVSIESQDHLDHVIFVFQERGKWGAVAHSRDEGLNGRPPIYRTLKSLVMSYFDPYIDKTGRIQGFQIASLDDTGSDWRWSTKSVWRAEQYLIDLPHHKIKTSDRRYRRFHQLYLRKGTLKRRPEWW